MTTGRTSAPAAGDGEATADAEGTGVGEADTRAVADGVADGLETSRMKAPCPAPFHHAAGETSRPAATVARNAAPRRRPMNRPQPCRCEPPVLAVILTSSKIKAHPILQPGLLREAQPPGHVRSIVHNNPTLASVNARPCPWGLSDALNHAAT